MSQTVRRALRVLDLLGRQPCTIEDVAAFIDAHRTTALRTLQVLEAERFVTRDEHHVFRLGSRILSLANAAHEQIDLRTTAARHLTELSTDVHHTIHLGAMEAGQVIYVDKRETAHKVRMYSRIGHAAPLYCTGLAKAIVAFLPRAEQEALAAGIDYVRFTENTITTTEAFLAELAAVRERGYATDHLEHESFVNCVAAPVFESSGSVTGSVSITATTLSCDYEEVLRLVPRLLRTTAAISSEYGWTP